MEKEMKIKCRKTNGLPLTLEKEYIALAMEAQLPKGIRILIQCDDKSIFFLTDGFEMVEQRKPYNWDIQIDNKTEIYSLMPKSWRYDSFLSDLNNNDPQAVALFNTESAIIYREMQ